MPNSLLAADTLFPKIDENKTQNENLRTVTNYLYMLVEELRYTFNNLDAGNFNEAGLEEIANIITEPVYVQLADDEGNISALMVQTDSLFSRMQDAEGNISSLTQTASAMQSRITSAEGDISTLTQTAESIGGRVSEVEGSYAELNLSVNGLTTRVQDAEGQVSTVTQTVNGLTVTDSYGTTLIAGNKIQTSTLYVDAAHVTGTLRAGELAGQYISLIIPGTNTDYEAGYISLEGASTGAFAVELGSAGALRLEAGARASAYIGCFGGGLELGYSNNLGEWVASFGLSVVPSGDGTRSCGATGRRWSQVWAVTGTIQTSDRQKKKDITYDMDAYEDVFDDLKPTPYKFIDGTSGRTHTGFISQDVEDSLYEHGMTALDLAAFCRDPRRDEIGEIIPDEYDYALRYEEFIALNTWQIQKLKARVSELEARLEAAV